MTPREPEARRPCKLDEVKGAGFRVKVEDRDQEERRWDEGVEEEFDGSLAPAIRAEEGDEDGHGDEREFPEAVVEEEIERDKDADHGGLLDQEEEVELFGAVLDRAPGDKHADGSEEGGKQNEPQRETIDAEVIANGGRGDPWLVFFELEAVVRVIEVRGQVEREDEGDERDEQSEGREDAPFARQKRDHDRARNGDEGDQRQDVVSQHGIVFRPSSQIKVSGPSEVGDGQQNGSEEGEPSCVGANIAGLNAGDQSSDALRAVSSS